MILLLNAFLFPNLFEPKVEEVSYGTFIQMIDDENIGEVEITSNQITFTDGRRKVLQDR